MKPTQAGKKWDFELKFDDSTYFDYFCKMKFFIPILLLLITLCPSLGQTPTLPDSNATPSEISRWQLSAIKGRPVHYAEEQQPITLQINPESGVISGHAGCNSYQANYKTLTITKTITITITETMTESAISIGETSTTQTVCPDAFMKLERQYLPLLQRATLMQQQDSTLILYQKDKELLRYDHLVR